MKTPKEKRNVMYCESADYKEEKRRNRSKNNNKFNKEIVERLDINKTAKQKDKEKDIENLLKFISKLQKENTELKEIITYRNNELYALEKKYAHLSEQYKGLDKKYKEIKGKRIKR